ncbi:hypothetical protein T459_14649 [Capsicum annuum]|uniref:Selenoprotein F n=1 Tax=Capsicum annuum TaxID=4072 RepID=A0A2G2ZI69_CAPAN|nr:hypothetical protein FXO37_23866 [Capsicum annuum]PHT81634.1 hypothetical protein T459_14649 [Capsicum annuum]
MSKIKSWCLNIWVVARKTLMMPRVRLFISRVVLEVSIRKLIFFLVGFSEEEEDQFPLVKVQNILNFSSKMIMSDDHGEHKKTIRIDNCKHEYISSFLKDKVKPSLDI